MKVTLVPANDIKSKNIIANLFHYYIYDMSEYTGWNPDSTGSYAVNFSEIGFDGYWLCDDHFPFLIQCDDEYAGFVMLRKYPEDSTVMDIGQFFVLKKYKGKGIGRIAFKLAVSAFPGKWQTRVLVHNTGALVFWKNVIGELVGKEFTSTREPYGQHQMHFIRYEIC